MMQQKQIARCRGATVRGGLTILLLLAVIIGVMQGAVWLPPDTLLKILLRSAGAPVG